MTRSVPSLENTDGQWPRTLMKEEKAGNNWAPKLQSCPQGCVHKALQMHPLSLPTISAPPASPTSPGPGLPELHIILLHLVPPPTSPPATRYILTATSISLNISQASPASLCQAPESLSQLFAGSVDRWPLHHRAASLANRFPPPSRDIPQHSRNPQHIYWTGSPVWPAGQWLPVFLPSQPV